MNYLSHFFLDHIPHDHYYNAGLILPDISKRWVKNLKQPLPSTFLPEQHRLAAGCTQHYLSDKKFHGSPYFENFLQEFTQAINHAGLSDAVQRKWFIAHIALELMIDRMLVKHFPSTVDAFYHSLVATDIETLLDFLSFHGMTDKAAFRESYTHFTDVQYIYYYTDNNKFTFSLNKIMARAGVAEMNEADTNKLLIALLNLENNYFADVHNHIKKLRAIFAI